MSVTRIASRYAKSLLDLAHEQGKMEKIVEDVHAFNKAASQRDFELVLKSPIIKSDKKQAIVKEIFDGKLDELTMAFLGIIIRKGREQYLPAVAKEFIAQHKAANQVSTVKVTTATPLDATSLSIIKAQLMGSDSTLDNIEIETVIDPSIIGGFVVEFADKQYDASVARKLELLKKEFSGNAYKKTM